MVYRLALLILCFSLNAFAQGNNYCPFSIVKIGGSIFNENEWKGDRMGRDLQVIGDADGDGYQDFVFRSNYYLASNNPARTWLFLASGRTGAIISEIPDPIGNGIVVWADHLALGPDADGDGVRDLIVHLVSVTPSTLSSKVYLMSGKTGQRVANVPLAIDGAQVVNITGLPDLNADKIPDYAITMEGSIPGVAFKSNLVSFKSGKDQHDLLNLNIAPFEVGQYSFDDFQSFGSDVIAVGDVNKDGVQDIVISAPQFTQTTNTEIEEEVGRRALFLVSGLDGSLFANYIRPVSQKFERSWKSFTTSLGDYDGDSISEIVVRWEDDVTSDLQLVQIFSGKTLSPLAEFQVFNAYSGPTRVPDQNADGASDFIFVSRESAKYYLLTYSGKSGALLTKSLLTNTLSDSESYFSEIAPLGDISNDGILDYALADPSFHYIVPPNQTLFNAGIVTILKSGPDLNSNGTPDYCELPKSTPTPQPTIATTPTPKPSVNPTLEPSQTKTPVPSPSTSSTVPPVEKPAELVSTMKKILASKSSLNTPKTIRAREKILASLARLEKQGLLKESNLKQLLSLMQKAQRVYKKSAVSGNKLWASAFAKAKRIIADLAPELVS